MLVSIVVQSCLNQLVFSSLCFLQQQLAHEELTVAVEMLSAVAVLNEVLDSRDPQGVIEQLSDLPMGFSNLDEGNFQRCVRLSLYMGLTGVQKRLL